MCSLFGILNGSCATAPHISIAEEASVCAILETPEDYMGEQVVISGWVFVHHRGTSIFAESGCSVPTLAIGLSSSPVVNRQLLTDALDLEWNESSRAEVFVRLRGTIQPSTRPAYYDVEIVPLEYFSATRELPLSEGPRAAE